MKAPSAFAAGLDVLAFGMVALFTFSMAATLLVMDTWVGYVVTTSLLVVGVYLTGRALLNLKARMSQNA